MSIFEDPPGFGGDDNGDDDDPPDLLMLVVAVILLLGGLVATCRPCGSSKNPDPLIHSNKAEKE